MKTNYCKYLLSILVLVFLFCSCKKQIDQEDDSFIQYTYQGTQQASYHSKQKDTNNNYYFTLWDSTYADNLIVKLNITKKMILFQFNKSNHRCSPLETEYQTPIRDYYYSIPLGYRIRYDIRISEDSLFAEYFNLDGLTDTFFVNKRLLFRGRLAK